MTSRAEQIAEQVKALPEDERQEFLSWLADFELERRDEWSLAGGIPATQHELPE